MKRISLSETGIHNIKDFNWVEYFKYNNSHLLKLDYSLNDELKHVVLQSDTLNRISSDRSELANSISRTIRKAIMCITSSVVWLKYKNVFEKGGYTKKFFKENCKFYLNESIAIEKTGSF